MNGMGNLRKENLLAAGASQQAVAELLAYAENRFAIPPVLPRCPLPHEGFADAWRSYAGLTAARGSIDVLRLKLVQLAFPVAGGMSRNEAYQAATRRGIIPPEIVDGGAGLQSPETCQVEVYDSFAGGIGILTAEHRADFETLVRVFAGKNEPIAIPKSMGATMISGYNNWHRIRLLKDEFLCSGGVEPDWPAEFSRIKAQRELYQDRFIVLSRGPYSGVDAATMNLDEEEWTALSGRIRREHEYAHYFTKRVFGSMQNNLLDEMVADYAGVRAARGCFRAEWMLRFLGLEAHPVYRAGGRLENYRGSPPLSDVAFRLLISLVWRAAWNLEQFDSIAGARLSMPAALMAIASFTIDELAAGGAPGRLVERYEAVADRPEEMAVAATQGVS
jgi:hypothetical protein